MTNTTLSGSAIRKRAWSFDRWWLTVLAVVLLILYLIFRKPYPYRDLFLFLQDGLIVTIILTAVSFSIVLVLGLFVALGRLSDSKIVQTLCRGYVEIIRGIPILVQILYWYFAMPAIVREIGTSMGNAALADFRPNAMVVAILALSVGYTAYVSEIYRAGIQSIPQGQMEAARSLGMTKGQAMRYIIIPQAVKVILPPVGNELMTLLKDTSLVSMVAVADLTRRGREFMASNANPIETWNMVALLYLVMTLILTRGISYLENKAQMEKDND